MLAVLVILLTAVFWLWPDTLPASTERDQTHWPGWGFTHTQFSADDGDPASIATAETAVTATPLVQAQHIMGFGADNPEPAPGVYDFATLDRRLDFIRRTGGQPVLTLCCAPDWMKGGQPSSTDWSRLEAAPLPEHFADFAALSATIARRYPDVRHFIVWNEFKGFFDDQTKRWAAKDYVDLYNAVYSAVKAVNPANQVGGPYLDFAQPFDASHRSPILQGSWGAVDQRVVDAFTYWQAHRLGADFVVVDGHANVTDGVTDEFAALKKFTAVDAWLRGRTDLPIWWAEWYVDPGDADWSAEHQVALRVAAMIELASSGADTVLYWNPPPGSTGCATCLWTDTRYAGGGSAQPFLTDILARFARTFPSGVQRHQLRLADGLRALVSDAAAVFVNTTGTELGFEYAGRHIDLAPYETRWITGSEN